MLHRILPVQSMAVLDPKLPSQSDVMAADTALVVVDVQDKFCLSGNEDGVKDVLSGISRARAIFNNAAKPVFLVYTAPPYGILTETSVDLKYAGFKNLEKLPLEHWHLEGEHRLHNPDLTGVFELAHKWANSAFRVHSGGEYVINRRAQLHRHLMHDYPNVSKLVIAGFNLGVCVMETANDAHGLGYQTTVLADASDNSFKEESSDYDYRTRKISDLETLNRNGIRLATLKTLKLDTH